MHEGFFDSSGVRLHFVDWGGDGSDVVLLGGLGATAHLFRGLAPKLAKRFRVTALTRRGHGRSARPESGYDLDTLVSDIARFLDAHAIERAVLVGHSFAGLEITRFAGLHPERTLAVIYLDALDVASERPPDGDPALAALDLVPSESDLASPDAYLVYHRRRPDVGAVWCDAVEADKREDMTIDGIQDPRSARARAHTIGPKLFAGLGANSKPDYGSVRAPMLAIVPAGRDNPFVPDEATTEVRHAANRYWVDRYLPWHRRRTETFREAVPHARVVELDTSNHTVFIAREDETVCAILDFLSGAVLKPDRRPTSGCT
jgi:pimeloyl-ACP methyl ester carboxylesterase